MEENNKIIAEFLGLIKTNIEVEDIWSTVEYLSDNPESTLICSVPMDTTPQFHRSWDCLMAVVEKIENTKIKDYSISINIMDDKTYISVWHYGEGGKWSILISNYNEEYKDFNKIQRTYKAVIEFINFYNKQKEE